MAATEGPIGAGKPPADADVGRIPRFALIIGAMKSGTSTLYRLLAQHPEICRCRVKEPNFFKDKSRLVDAADYYKLWDFDPRVHKWALEASTAYTKYGFFSGMAERMSDFPAEFRLIYILRDPVDRIESALAHNVNKGRLGNLGPDGVKVTPKSIATSSYAMQLDRYKAVIPDVPILLLDMLDLETPAGTRSVTRRCAEFLEIDTSFSFKEIAPRNVRRKGGRADEVVLTDEQREGLRQALSEDVRRLRSHYGFDTSRWPGFD